MRQQGRQPLLPLVQSLAEFGQTAPRVLVR